MSTIEGPVTQVRSTAPRYTAAMTIRGKVADAGLADDLELNTRYFRSWPGLLKLLQLVLAIVALCCISPPLTWFSRLFTYIQSVALAFTFLLCFAYLITLQRALWPRFNWLLAELIFTAVASVSLFLSSLLLIGFTTREDYRLSLTYYDSYIGTTYFATYIAAGIFGLFGSFAYAAGTYLLYRHWRHPDTAVGPTNTKVMNT